MAIKLVTLGTFCNVTSGNCVKIKNSHDDKNCQNNYQVNNRDAKLTRAQLTVLS